MENKERVRKRKKGSGEERERIMAGRRREKRKS